MLLNRDDASAMYKRLNVLSASSSPPVRSSSYDYVSHCMPQREHSRRASIPILVFSDVLNFIFKKTITYIDFLS